MGKSAERNEECLKQEVISFFYCDYDNDGNEELLTVEADSLEQFTEEGKPYGNRICVYEDYSFDSNGSLIPGTVQYTKDKSALKPLRIHAGDINGDGITEIGIVTYKMTQFHPVMAERPFFYAIDGDNLVKVWLGSRLSRPFKDFTLNDIDGDGIDEIVAIEYLEDKREVFAVYDWQGFGFDMKCQSEPYGDISFTHDRHRKCDKLTVLADVEGILELSADETHVTVKKGELDK
ncbi:MAG: hypothetical protein MJ119_06400 [Lachnospiraceae bacterium]|nr:hypothetical protein [Lachnospiraceae bacterium]